MLLHLLEFLVVTRTISSFIEMRADRTYSLISFNPMKTLFTEQNDCNSMMIFSTVDLEDEKKKQHEFTVVVFKLLHTDFYTHAQFFFLAFVFLQIRIHKNKVYCSHKKFLAHSLFLSPSLACISAVLLEKQCSILNTRVETIQNCMHNVCRELRFSSCFFFLLFIPNERRK